ncbi:MAG: polysaccharide deacetylase family protein, partial [Victivallales bacterium]|nr:polysaccharide deacetylase family protein [Victivallales bacterium]
MKRIDFAWPQGLSGALTTSWDDGTEFDRRLVEILNAHGIKGTFNLNSGMFGFTREQSKWKNYISADEVASLYAGHEVAVHTVSHPWLQRLSDDMIRSEVLEDRRTLEQLVGYPVRGMALPYGTDDERVRAILRSAGIVYVRPVVRNSEPFALPGDFMNWQVTAHHKNDIRLLWKEFVEYHSHSDKLFYLWGHSYEFADNNNWNLIEEFALYAG